MPEPGLPKETQDLKWYPREKVGKVRSEKVKQAKREARRSGHL